MKQGTLTTKLAMLLIFLAITGYFVASAVRSFYQPFSTVLSYSYQTDDVVEATGFLVREEQVIPGATQIMDVVPHEGERVAVGETVAYLYQDSVALDRKRELQALTLEQEQLEYAMADQDTGWDNAQLDQWIMEATIALKTATSHGDLAGLEEQAMVLKSLMIRQEYNYDGSGSDMQTMLDGTQAEIVSLQSSASLDTTLVRVAQSGSFSAMTDGYESTLTPTAVEGLTPTSYRALTHGTTTPPDDVVGKLITDDSWQFITTLPIADAERLSEGQTVMVRFSRDWSGEVPMDVTRISDPEGGNVAVVFTTDRYLSQVTLLRKQTVELVFDSVEGVRVPKMALRSLTVTATHPDTDEEIQRQAIGVYVVSGMQAEFKEVDVVDDDGDFYLLQAIDPDDRSALRAGDEVIVAAVDLYDGKVVG